MVRTMHETLKVSVQINREHASEYKRHAHMTPKGGKSLIGAVTNKKGGKNGEER